MLETLRENIISFLRSGGVSVGYHTMNQESRKYFKRALAISGSPITYFGELDSNNHTDLVIDIARRNGHQINNQIELLEYLKTVTSKEIFEDGPQAPPNQRIYGVAWAPIVEGLAVFQKSLCG